MIFDTHAHYDDHAFDEDREEVLSGLFEKGVGKVMDASAAARSMPVILELTRKYDFLYGSAGLHPCETYGCGDNMGKPVMYRCGCEAEGCGPGLVFAADPGLISGADPGLISGADPGLVSDADPGLVSDADSGLVSGAGAFSPEITRILQMYSAEEIITEDWRAGEREEALIRAMLREPKIMAVGEIGLDYHYDDTRKEVQQDWFARQIAIAREFHKPVFVHSRDAAADTLDMIRAERAADAGGIIHCFSYSKEMAGLYVDLGFMIGIGGVVTYKNAKKLKEVAAFVPLESIVLETDCPYLAPSPFRGQRNDSSMIRYAAEAIAQLKGVSTEEVIEVTEQNACRVYGITE